MSILEKLKAAKAASVKAKSVKSFNTSTNVGNINKKGTMTPVSIKHPRRQSTSVTMDGETFTGYTKGNKNRAVLKVSNPKLGTTVSREKFRNDGTIKSSRTVDKFPSGKKVVTNIKN
jgi:hypothetical protein